VEGVVLPALLPYNRDILTSWLEKLKLGPHRPLFSNYGRKKKNAANFGLFHILSGVSAKGHPMADIALDRTQKSRQSRVHSESFFSEVSQ
jgi:hypothetical protein